MIKNLRLWVLLIELIDGIAKTTIIEASVLLENAGVAEFKMQGKGFGKLLSHLYIVAALNEVKSDFDMLNEENSKFDMLNDDK